MIETIDVTLCGHVNKHSYGEDGKLDYLSCTLPPGHAGDNTADHLEAAKELHPDMTAAQMKRFEEVIDPKTGEPTYRGMVERSWGEMAGIPVEEIKPSSPGEELLSSDQYFPELQKARMDDIDGRIDGLEAQVSNLSGDIRDLIGMLQPALGGLTPAKEPDEEAPE